LYGGIGEASAQRSGTGVIQEWVYPSVRLQVIEGVLGIHM
jgi:hypothetical protein